VCYLVGGAGHGAAGQHRAALSGPQTTNTQGARARLPVISPLSLTGMAARAPGRCSRQACGPGRWIEHEQIPAPERGGHGRGGRDCRRVPGPYAAVEAVVVAVTSANGTGRPAGPAVEASRAGRHKVTGGRPLAGMCGGRVMSCTKITTCAACHRPGRYWPVPGYLFKVSAIAVTEAEARSHYAMGYRDGLGAQSRRYARTSARCRPGRRASRLGILGAPGLVARQASLSRSSRN
jgi:hypothetical protein